jgi:DNA-binding response OmpR family regulator
MTAYDGEEALLKVDAHEPDIVVLDVMLPRIDGFEVCRRIRQRTTIPVFMLTARKEDLDVIHGLELGADDYLTKPFNHVELVLRIKAVLRRTGVESVHRSVKAGPLTIDSLSHKVSLHGIPVHLTPTEFRLFQCLVNNAGRVLSWESLLLQVWRDEPSESGRELVKANIRRLRQKIEPDPNDSTYVLSVRGVGYMFVDPSAQAT